MNPEARARVYKWIWIHGVLVALPTAVLLVAAVAHELAQARMTVGPDPQRGVRLLAGLLGVFVVGIALSAPFVWGLIRALVEWRRPVAEYGMCSYPLVVFAAYPLFLLVSGPFAPLLIGTVTLVFWVDAAAGAGYLLGFTRKWRSSV